MSEKTKDKSTMTNICCICGETFTGYGNNPWPVVKDKKARCCDYCNSTEVIPTRIKEMRG